MFNIIDNKTASNNRNTAAATVAPIPFTNVPTKVDDILPHMTAPAVFDIGAEEANGAGRVDIESRRTAEGKHKAECFVETQFARAVDGFAYLRI